MYQIFSRQNLKKRRKRDFVHSQEIRQKCNVREHLLVMSLVTCGTFLTTLGSARQPFSKIKPLLLNLVASCLIFIQWGFSRFTDKKIPVSGNVSKVSDL